MTEVLPETPHPGNGHQTPNALTTPPQNMVPGVSPALAPAHAPVHQGTHPGTHGGAPSPAHRGREKLHWGKEVWDRLDHAVHKEIERTRVAAKFLPHHRVPPHTTSVPADIVIVPPAPSQVFGPGPDGATLVPNPNLNPDVSQSTWFRWVPPLAPTQTSNNYAVDEGATTRLIELWVEFSLTPQQVEQEGSGTHHQNVARPAHSEHGHPGHSEHGHHGDSTAATLATRAANILAQAEDMLMFDGLGAFTSPLYTNFVGWRSNGEPVDWGLLEAVPALAAPTPLFPPPLKQLPDSQIIPVLLKTPVAGQPPSLYGENTFQAVTAGYAQLMGNGQYGPYALTMHNIPYADSFAPLPDTLIMPADRIAPLMTAGFRDSGTLDAPGATAAAIAAAAATATAGAAPAPQQAAASTAATFAINYGASIQAAAGAAANAANAAGAAVGTGANQAATLAAAAVITAATTAGFQGIQSAATIASNITLTGLPAGMPQYVGLPSYYGSLVSLGGNTMDLVVGIEPTVAFEQQDVNGNYRFRVVERLALRLKDYTAIIRLEFQ
jgi:hypothetical protein